MPPSGYLSGMSNNVRGIYRTAGKAFVTDDVVGFDIPEVEYRESGYTPDYDALPAKDAYARSRVLFVTLDKFIGECVDQAPKVKPRTS
jgi:hypothetical protein